MPSPADIEVQFWKELKSDMTMMLGLVGVEEGHTRPMTAQLEGEAKGPIWFFSSTETDLVKNLSAKSRAVATFASKKHDLFAAVHGTIRIDNDPAVIDRLWNKFVGAWYEGGKTDPKLTLLRLDADRGEIWLNGSSLVAGIKLLFGADPKQEYKDNVAKVSLA